MATPLASTLRDAVPVHHHGAAALRATGLIRSTTGRGPVPCPSTGKGPTTVGGRSTLSNKQSSTTSSKWKTVSSGKTVSGKKSGTGVLKPTWGRGVDEQTQQYPSKPSQSYFFFTGFPFPLGPTFKRNTVRTEIEKDTLWVFEQTQALEFVDVYTPLRMTVIKLKSGGLWVHAPCAPTKECIDLIKELDAPVEFIVLPTFAYEHKAFLAPFSRKFPKAKLYVGPDQWSLPFNLPNEFLGIFGAKKIKKTVAGDPDPHPWSDEIEAKPLFAPCIAGPDYVRNGETAFFHKRTRSLLFTDAVVFIPREPAKVVPKQALIAIGKGNWLARYRNGGRSWEETDRISRQQLDEDTPENRRRGWMRMSLLVLYFNPFDLLTPEESFDAVSERLIVPPVVATLVYDKFPFVVCDWVDEICREWDFKQVIPCHFAAPVKVSVQDLKNAFAFAYEGRKRLIEAGGSSEGVSDAGASGSDDADAAAAGGGIGGFFKNLLKGKLPYVKEQEPRSIVEFPEFDVGTLKNLNNFFLKTGILKPPL